uniref:Uncharacterized protein n=1 Tax=Tanacetum cinerariifolium TaxID=118510 RepID=A0A6L2MAH9_TANCI|nr:hypothetical protein [Tanacetum cinerariifolium]
MSYNSLVQFEPHVLASKAKKSAKNHDPLALIAHFNSSSSQSRANSSYSLQPYYATHPSSVVDYEYEYQGELQRDSQADKLTTAMMLLARAVTQKFFTPTNNRLRTSSNTKNQAVIQDGRVDIQTKNAGYGGNGNKNIGRQSRNQAFNLGNGNNDIHYARDCQKTRVRDAKYFRKQMLSAMKNEAGSNLNNEENDFMLDTSYGEETMEELTVAVMLMAQIQPADGIAETVPSYDAKALHLRFMNKCVMRNHKTIIQTSDDDQIDSNTIFDDPYVKNNGGTSVHDSNDHDEYHKIKMLAYDVQREDENKKRLNNELKKQKMLLQKELETCERLAKKAFKEQENRYLEDICDFEEKLSSHDRIVYKMGQSVQTIHMLGKTPTKVYDPFLKAGLSYKDPEHLKKAIAAQQKMYDGEKLHSTKLVIDLPDSGKTLEEAKKSRLKMRNKIVQFNYAKLNALYETFIPQKDFFIEQTYFSIPSTSTSTNGSESKAVTSDSPIPKMLKESKLLKMFDTLGMAINGLRTRINNTLLKDRQRRWMFDSQNYSREFYKTDVILMSAYLSKNLQELKEELIEEVQEMLSILNDENVLLKTQAESIVQERENVKLECQKLFNSIKSTQTQHKKELDELIEHVNQKTYAYVDVHAQNQDLLITISELKNKLKTVDKGKNVNTKFDKSEASGTLLCVTSLPKNIAIKAKKVSNSKVNTDRSKPVTSQNTPTNEQGQTQNENVLIRGMYRITKTATQTPDSKTNINVSNSTCVESSNSVRRQKSKDTKSKNRVLKNTNAKSLTAHIQKMLCSVSIAFNKCETMN